MMLDKRDRSRRSYAMRTGQTFFTMVDFAYAVQDSAIAEVL